MAMNSKNFQSKILGCALAERAKHSVLLVREALCVVKTNSVYLVARTPILSRAFVASCLTIGFASLSSS
jgi:hypothetical protein